MQLSEIRKNIVAVATTIVAATPWILQAEGVVHLGNTEIAIVSAVLGAAGWVVHYLAPNETSDPKRVEGRSVRLRGSKPVRRPAGKPGGTTKHSRVVPAVKPDHTAE